ncbi:PD-(D/E)XK nuclease domain-containing protein, partial [Candidatus Vampirococcus lugosii]
WQNNNPEGWFKSFIGMFLKLNTIQYYGEVENLKGRKDLVIPINNKYYIIEAKVNNSAKKAIEQINKKYLPQFSEDDEIVKIGINWNKKGGEFDVVYEK